MILPKHAYEAFIELNRLQKETSPSKSKSEKYFADEETYSVGKTMDIITYIELLMLATASLNGKITPAEEKAIQFVTGTKDSYKAAAREDMKLIKTCPPALLFDAFIYQHETGKVILPELLNYIETIVRFIGQVNNSRDGDIFVAMLMELYQHSLEKNKILTEPRQGREDTGKRFEAPDELEEALSHLNGLTGLSEIKAEVASMIDLIRLREIRKTHSLKIPEMSLHMVFSGNPGTGKTTVARILADIYRALGVLSEGHLIETDRSGLVGGYMGQTALKVQEVVTGAIGGILFIDEAYSLYSDQSSNDYGKEAIETLLKLMEDHRENLVVIVAGYTDLMENFLDSNPGLRSRFNKKFIFPDYSEKELMEIFRSMCHKNSYNLSREAEEKAAAYFNRVVSKKSDSFGNAREVRNFFEKTIARQASRIVRLTSPSKNEIQQLEAADLNLKEDRNGS